MWNKINNIFLGRGLVFKNFIALGFLQGTNFLIPLIIMPYLVVHIGYEGYGIVNFVNAVMIYFASFTDYGFTVSATRDLAVNKENKEVVSAIFSRVLVCKMLLLVLSGLILFPLIALVPQFAEEPNAFALGFFIVMGQAILPVWFFQGMEKMKYITYLNLAAKLLFTALIFIYVKEADDYPLVLLFYGLGNVFSGILGLFMAYKQFDLTFIWPSYPELKEEIIQGWNLFLANFSIVSYMNSNVFILGLFASNLIVGYYSVAEKIVMAMRQLLTVFHQATYPHVCQLVVQGKKFVLTFYRQVFLSFLAVFLVFSIGVYFFSAEIIQVLADEAKPEIVELLHLLCFVPLVVAFNIPAYQSLLANKFEKSATFILVLGSVLNIGLNLYLAPQWFAAGTAYSVIVTELFISIALHLMLALRHPKYSLFSNTIEA